MPADPGEDAAAPLVTDPPSLDRALWAAASTPVLREHASGIAASVLIHLVVAGGMVAAAGLLPAPEPPGLIEIPVEIVAAGSVPEPEPPAPAPRQAPPSPTAAVQDHASVHDRDEDVAEQDEAPPPETIREQDTAARDHDSDVPRAGEPPAPEPSGPMQALTTEPTGPEPALFGRTISASPPDPGKPATPKKAEPRESKPAIARIDSGRNRKVAAEESTTPRQSAQSKRPERGTRPPTAGSGVAQRGEGSLPRRGGTENAPSDPNQGRSAAAGASAAAAASYRGQVIAHLTRFKRYPLAAETRGAEGTPVVSFSLNDGGGVASVSLARSSGHPDIDAETVAMVRRAVPFPAPPPGAPDAITAAISFQLR
jgi:periplasmic protein TonB